MQSKAQKANTQRLKDQGMAIFDTKRKQIRHALLSKHMKNLWLIAEYKESRIKK